MITKEFANIIIKLSSYLIEFTQMYEQSKLKIAENQFEIDRVLKMCLNSFIRSTSEAEMNINIDTFTQSVNLSIILIEHLNRSFENKNELIGILRNMYEQLTELEKLLTTKI